MNLNTVATRTENAFDPPHSLPVGLAEDDYYFNSGERKLALTLIRSSIEDMIKLQSLGGSPGRARQANDALIETLEESVAWVKDGNEGLISFREACWIIAPALPYRALGAAILADPEGALKRLAKAQEKEMREQSKKAREDAVRAEASVNGACGIQDDFVDDDVIAFAAPRP